MSLATRIAPTNLSQGYWTSLKVLFEFLKYNSSHIVDGKTATTAFPK